VSPAHSGFCLAKVVAANTISVTPMVEAIDESFTSANRYEVTRPLILSEARWSKDDPLRVSLLTRAQRAGVVLDPLIEVEFQTHALELAAPGRRRLLGLVPRGTNHDPGQGFCSGRRSNRRSSSTTPSSLAATLRSRPQRERSFAWPGRCSSGSTLARMVRLRRSPSRPMKTLSSEPQVGSIRLPSPSDGRHRNQTGLP
jgi:hypothetical protein